MAQRMRQQEPFRRSVWHDRINYECGSCAFATLDALKMASHLKSAHGIGTGAAVPAAVTPVVLAQESEFESESEVNGND